MGVTEAEVESARREWQEGHRRLLEAAREAPARERLFEQVDVVAAELRRRVGGTFTIRELAAAYADAERWSAAVDEDAELAADLVRATGEQRSLRLELAGGRTGRDGGASLGLGIGGSANPRRLKCLHAHVAYALAHPAHVLGAQVLAELEPLWPTRACCTAQ